MKLPREHDRLAGHTLGEFVLSERIGQGGFGAVYRAVQPALDREAVVKVLHARLRTSSMATERFLREAKLASKLDHPYAAHIYAFGAEPDGELWIAMELVRGTPLDHVLKLQGPLSLERMVPLLERICEVVHTAHEQGIVHRDLKPANVMVLARAGRLLPKLLDFGIAKAAAEPDAAFAESDTVRTQEIPATSTPMHELTQRGEIMGSPVYMAPEQWVDAGAAGPASDLYALGVLAFQCLTGKPPFGGQSLTEIAIAHARQAPPPIGPGFPAALDRVFAKVLAKKPHERYPDALAFAAALRQASGVASDSVDLPRLAAAVRDPMVNGGPQPIADAIIAYEAARNAHQARDALVVIAHCIARYAGLLAVACRSRLPQEGEREAGAELLRTLGRRSLADREWLELARLLTSPWTTRRDAYPLPELVGAFHDGDVSDELVALSSLREQETPGDHLAALLETSIERLGRILEALAFVRDYALVTVVTPGWGESWMGTRRAQRATVTVRSRGLEAGAPALVDKDGAAVLSLAPLFQIAAPTPGAPLELFLFEGRDPRGAKLVALPSGFEHHDDALWDWFRSQLAGSLEGDHAAVAEEKPPYRGLQAFSQEDGPMFYGREAQVDAFTNRLKLQPLLAVVGRSGAGKSSFVHAGVVPALGWRAITMRPGAAPLGALTARLESAGCRPIGKAALAADRDALGELLRADAAERGPVVLVVDQLEEMFTLCGDGEERSAFAEAIAAAVRAPDDPVRVIFTLRDDFLVRTEQVASLRNRIGHGLELLTVPGAAELLRIVTEPARRVGYEFEDPALPEEMVQEVADQPGALALISFTASKLWELRDRHFKRLTRAAYKTLGGVGGALARHAELTLEAMPSDQRALAREAFRHLVTTQSTRAVLVRDELRQLLGSDARADSVIEKLVAARLLVASEDESGAETIEIVHEALLVAWPRLVEWRREDSEGARFREQLRAAARQWDERGRARGLLWRGDALADYTRWRARHTGVLTTVETAFTQASLHEATRGRRIRNTLVTGAIAGPLAAAVVLFALNARLADQRTQTERANATVNLTLQRQYETHGREKLLAGEPLLALAYLDAAGKLGAEGPAHDFLLAHAVRATEGKVFEVRHANSIRSPHFSPDGTRLITAGFDQQARVWDARDGKLLATLPHAGIVSRATFSPDGKTALTASFDGTAAWWDATTGKRLRELHHDGYVWCALYSPDGTLAVTAGADDKVVLTELAGGERWRASGTGAGMHACAFSHDGTKIAVSDNAGVTRLFDVATGKLLRTLGDHHAVVHFVAFSPDDTRLVSASEDGTAVEWDAASGQLQHVFHHDGDVVSAEFSPDGLSIVTASADHTAVIWNAESGVATARLVGHASDVMRAVFSPDGKYVVTGSRDAEAWLWDVATARVVARWQGHADAVYDIAFAPDGKHAVTASDDSSAIVWSVEPQERTVWLHGHDGNIVAASFSPDGSRVATAGNDRTVRIWDVETGRQLAELHHPKALTDVRFGPDNDTLVTGGLDGVVRIWRHGQPTELPGTADYTASVWWSLEANEIVAASQDGSLRAWDSSGRALFTIPRAHNGEAVITAVIDPEGKRIVTTSWEPVVRYWDVAGKPLSQFADSSFPLGAVFDPSGMRVVGTINGLNARIWSVATGKHLVELVGHSGLVLSATWNPRGNLIVTASLDGTARIWDAATGDPLAILAHPRGARAAAFSPDGRRVIVVGDAGTAVIHELASDKDLGSRVAHALRCRVPFELRDDRVQRRALPGGDCH